MRFAAYMAVSFIIYFHIMLVLFCIIVYGSVFCMLLFNFVQVSLMYFYCYLCFVLGILLHCVVCV